MMRTPFFSALLAACMLHIVGLAVASLGWQAWRESSPIPQLDTPALVAVVPIPEPPRPEPEPTPEPDTPPIPAALPVADIAPEPIPTTPVMPVPIVPPPDIAPPPPKQLKARSKLTPAPTPTPRPVLARERRPRPSLPAPAQPDAPLGNPGSDTAGPASSPAAPELPRTPGPGGAADVGHVAAHGEVPVAAGSSSGTGGSGARTVTGGGTSAGPGAGRGSADGSSGVSARPLGGYQVKPRYPESARRQGVEGTVLLKMRITEHGRVEDVQVERSAGHPDLDQSALEAVRRWRFEPARRAGAAVAMWVLIPVEFKIQ